jgi:hypothetical protein
MRSVGRRKRAR